MTGTQYEELCRRYVAEKFGIPLERVLSKNVPGAVRPGDTKFEHQIDLWWETGNESIRVVYIADAKWRSRSKVDQPDVVALEYARDGVGAQKAMVLTNNDFTEGALGIADRHGIALHTVRPTSATSTLPTGSSAAERAAIAGALATAAVGQATPLYTSTVVHRGFEPSTREAAVAPPAFVAPAVQATNRMATGYTNRAIGGGGDGGGARGGGGFTGGANRGGGGFRTR